MLIHKLVPVILIILLSINSVGICLNEGFPAKVLESELNKSIDKAIDILLVNQMESGEFPTDACSDQKMMNCSYDPSPFLTSLVLYSLKDIDDQRAIIMTRKGIKFFLAEQESGGIWRYWSSKNSKEIDPDLDDIAMISYILKVNNISFGDNSDIVENNKNKTGLFNTWIRPPERDNVNDVDCVVNANVLLYMGSNNSDVCAYLNSAIRYNHQSNYVYYLDNISLSYAIARAYKNNVLCLNESQQIIIKNLKLTSKANGSFGNSLQTALALDALMDFGYRGLEVERGIAYLIKTQSKDGSWNTIPFYLGPAPYYGSKELTTALALEALNKYKIFFINQRVCNDNQFA